MLQNKLRIEGAEVSYSSWGSENSNKMIFIHDNPGSSADLHPANITALAKNFHVVVFDRAGHGESSLRNIDFETSRDSILKIAETLKFESFVLMAHSWGSLFAFDFAEKNPEMVESLFLINPIAFEMNQKLNFPLGLLKTPGLFSILRSKLESKVAELQKQKCSRETSASAKSFRLSKKEAIGIALEENLLTQSLESFKNIYPQIQKHVLILATKDNTYANWEQQADRLYQILPDANIVLEPKGGHLLIAEDSAPLQRASKLIQKQPERRVAHA